MINKKIDVIMIDPFDQSISRVDLEENPVGLTLESLKKIMQCRTIDVVNLEADVILVVYDEGRLINDNRWFSLGSNTFAGRCILANTNEDGDTITCDRTVEEIINLTEFLEEGYSEEPFMEFRAL